ncbi:glyoxalase/bleomycin resistance/extradiol dioxygenase family protein [soil metagenome]
MKVDDVLECCIYAPDVAAAADFYSQVLGLESFSVVAGRHAFFRCGGRVFLLFNPQRTLESDSVPAHGALGPGHVAFSVQEQDLSEWREHLRRCGIPVESELEWPNGGRSIYVRDPAGNSVELAPARIWTQS